MTDFPIIISGFKKFNAPYNPSEDVAKYFEGRQISGNEVGITVLPVEFRGAAETLYYLIETYGPRVVLSTGLSAAGKGTRREGINIERRGLNLMNAKNPDRLGQTPQNETIERAGPDFVYLEWDADELAGHLMMEGVRARSSDDAGKYVCNDLLYRVALKIKRDNRDTKFGYIHIPWLDKYREGSLKDELKIAKIDIEQKATMPLDEVAKGVELIVEKLLE